MRTLNRNKSSFWYLLYDSKVPAKDEYGQRIGWTGYTWQKELFPSPANFLRWTENEQLKVALNLHPADASPPLSTAGVEGALAPAGTLVERPIRIASFANGGAATSVEDLGHHAGYYRLPNTHDAR